MTNRCGFCRDFRLFFSLLFTHSKKFLADFTSYRKVCMVASNLQLFNGEDWVSIEVPSTVQKLRDQAVQNFRNLDRQNSEPIEISVKQ